MDRGIRWPSVVLSLVILAGCSAGAGTTISATPAPTAAWTSVHFGSAKLDVPSNWPVHDLSKDPKLCVRFDQSAVYLGRQGPEPKCPARLLGRTSAVQVQLLDPATVGQLVPAAAGAGAANAKGQVHHDQPNSSTTRSIVAAFPKLGVLVTASYQQDPSVAQRIIDSVDAA
ncbi:MAG: hypothetical protein M3N98_13955 [Actinomycetota bacterium]|nr:hypothetical protein [Actinomycetota bacterium]